MTHCKYHSNRLHLRPVTAANRTNQNCFRFRPARRTSGTRSRNLRRQNVRLTLKTDSKNCRLRRSTGLFHKPPPRSDVSNAPSDSPLTERFRTAATLPTLHPRYGRQQKSCCRRISADSDVQRFRVKRVDASLRAFSTLYSVGKMRHCRETGGTAGERSTVGRLVTKTYIGAEATIFSNDGAPS